jgi:hypothetical protein
MYQVNLAEAITRLRDLINAAVSGETVSLSKMTIRLCNWCRLCHLSVARSLEVPKG